MTRSNVAAVDHLTVVERILRSLSDYLGEMLLVDDEMIENGVLSLMHADSLEHWVNLELERSEQTSAYWREYWRQLGHEGARYDRALGSVVFVTDDGTKNVYLDFDEYPLAPNVDEFNFGNGLSIESEEKSLSGERLAETALFVMKRIFDNDLFDYGDFCPNDQASAKNIDYSGGGMVGMGADVSKALPGFYWGNYFGSFLCDLIGTERLLSVPGCHSIRLESGVLVINELPPDRWSEPEFIDRENRAMDHIGRHLFFEKGKPMTGTLFTVE